jgi:hypothetical protein
MSAAEVVTLIQQKIKNRDCRVRDHAVRKGLPVPEWVGED